MAKAAVMELRGKHLFEWKCRETTCGHVQQDAVKCEKCGQFAIGFDKIERPIAENSPAKDYEVLGNISYEGKLIKKGDFINLFDADPATKSLLARNLVKVIKKDK